MSVSKMLTIAKDLRDRLHRNDGSRSIERNLLIAAYDFFRMNDIKIDDYFFAKLDTGSYIDTALLFIPTTWVVSKMEKEMSNYGGWWTTLKLKNGNEKEIDRNTKITDMVVTINGMTMASSVVCAALELFILHGSTDWEV